LPRLRENAIGDPTPLIRLSIIKPNSNRTPIISSVMP